MIIIIKLIDDYVIIGNDKDYSLAKYTGKKDKNGKDIFKIKGYYNSIPSCIKACYFEKCLELTKLEDLELKDAINKFNDIKNDLEKIIPKF